MIIRLNLLTKPRLIFSIIMASVVGLEVVDKSSIPISGNSAEFFDNAPTHFSIMMDIVVGL